MPRQTRVTMVRVLSHVEGNFQRTSSSESDDGPAQESENGMAVLFSLLLRFAGLTDPPVLLPERTITVESPSFIV